MAKFVKGQSGNPGGKPKAARNKLGGDFVHALAQDFAEHGAPAIERVRTDDPASYLRIIASVLPKELVLTDERGVSDIPDDELASIATGRSDRAAEATQGPQEPDSVH